MEQVTLVDENDNPIGLMEKMEAHEKGLLHRAFSVFIFNDKKELLLQRRAFDKYHSGGLWTNTCCSHPRENETIIKAGKRRLMEEMGFITDIIETFSFVYNQKLDNNLTEHELDHILIGKFNDNPNPNPVEVSEWKYISMEDLENDLEKNPEQYTVWLKIVFNRLKVYLNEKIDFITLR